MTKIGIVLSTNDPEEVWNAFRFGNVALKENHAVRVFLVNKGVEAEDIRRKISNQRTTQLVRGEQGGTLGVWNLHESKDEGKQRILPHRNHERPAGRS